MKVTFTCEKCGHEFLPDLLSNGHDGNYATYRFATDDCPRCAEPTYGPLTVEMVAEALEAVYQANGSRHAPRDGPRWSGQSRFVLRLLERLDRSESLGLPWVSGDEREWLLDLARRP